MLNTNFNLLSRSTIHQQQPCQPIIKKILVQTPSPTAPLPSLRGGKLEQNSSAITLTDKVASTCIAVYLSTWISDIPVKMGTLCVSKVLQGEIWRVGTSAILHTNIAHLCMNMTGLKKFGPIVEDRWGARGFAKIAACAIVATTATEILFGDYSQGCLGFSGVLFAFAGASHLTKSETGIKIDPKSKDFWAQQIAFGLFMNYAANYAGLHNISINHKAHLSGYMAGMAFSYFSN